ncbi:putative 30 kda heat shock protein [Phaeomoniella chlamydospora]|uniref:Putative 30 kDa heat shock protein n=1 Tax=Phaeomoniella chlamydospora TaxID=158046 RepID=A0A0G2F2J2_PHACM|nr:putative 30 kda heat shock protein [Phaeomoniella chlamydospora]
MQAYRTKLPSLCKVIKPVTTQTRTMAFFPRHYNSAFGSDFSPLFRLLDDVSDLTRPNGSRVSSVRAWAPRFNVAEHEDSYQLDGELPGVDQKNVSIEFTDPHTLVIKGHTEQEYTSGEPLEDVSAQGRIENVKNSHKPTVEDEGATTTSTAVATTSNEQQVQKSGEPKYKSWISERSFGEFHRSFSFPSRVDQDAVKASLKNGILSIIVPKMKAPQSRKITIE